MARNSQKAQQLKQELLSAVQQHDLITQPVTFAYLNGELSVMHARIQSVIMERLQLRIAKEMKDSKEGKFTGSLFKEEDFGPVKGESGKYISFTVKYSQLGVTPANYRYVSEAARAMQGSLVYEKEVDGYVRYIVAFPIVDVPDEKKGERRTDIKLYMTESTAKYLFRLTPYHRYLKNALLLFSSGYAARIYLLINANKSLGTWTIDYQKLRKILLTSYDHDKKRYVCDKYASVRDFKRRVLDPAKKEIDEAVGRIDCTFDYEFIYPLGKKRGTPEKIAFHIHLTDLGRIIKRGSLESQDAIELRNSLMALHLSLSDINRLMKQTTPENYVLLTGKAHELKKYYEDVNSGKIPNVAIKDTKAHTIKSLQNLIRENDFIEAEEVKETPKEEPKEYIINEW